MKDKRTQRRLTDLLDRIEAAIMARTKVNCYAPEIRLLRAQSIEVAQLADEESPSSFDPSDYPSVEGI